MENAVFAHPHSKSAIKIAALALPAGRDPGGIQPRHLGRQCHRDPASPRPAGLHTRPSPPGHHRLARLMRLTPGRRATRQGGATPWHACPRALCPCARLACVAACPRAAWGDEQKRPSSQVPAQSLLSFLMPAGLVARPCCRAGLLAGPCVQLGRQPWARQSAIGGRRQAMATGFARIPHFKAQGEGRQARQAGRWPALLGLAGGTAFRGRVRAKLRRHAA